MTSISFPRWKTAIEKAIAEYKNQNIIQLATIGQAARNPPSQLIPRVRSLVFREFLVSKGHESLPLLISTTDVRSPKVSQLTAHPTAEIVWWIEGAKEQFRLVSDVYIVPHPEHELYSHFLGVLADAKPGGGISAFKTFEWEPKCVEVFKSLSPQLRASWLRPVPGARLEGGQEEAKRWPEKLEEPSKDLPREKYEEAQRNWEIALSRFALVVIDPFEVDYIELGVTPNRRAHFTRGTPTDSAWDEEELVP